MTRTVKLCQRSEDFGKLPFADDDATKALERLLQTLQDEFSDLPLPVMDRFEEVQATKAGAALIQQAQERTDGTD